jgi:hypothetical protein
MCRSGCATQDHSSYGECLRAATVRVAYCNSAQGYDYSKQKSWDSELQAYRDARAQGIEPEGTDRRSIEEAVRISDRIGKAHDAANPIASLEALG